MRTYERHDTDFFILILSRLAADEKKLLRVFSKKSQLEYYFPFPFLRSVVLQLRLLNYFSTSLVPRLPREFRLKDVLRK